jgi:hypothetical protein
MLFLVMNFALRFIFDRHTLDEIVSACMKTNFARLALHVGSILTKEMYAVEIVGAKGVIAGHRTPQTIAHPPPSHDPAE